MRLQVFDDKAHFECGSCTACCDQPWRTLIEADRAKALDGHDFSAYPQLDGREFYRPADEDGFFELAKGQGTRCLFLDHDGLCIIHKELGAQSKPTMCQRFPYLRVRTRSDERISVNYGCPSVQAQHGPGLSDQVQDISVVFPPPADAGDPEAAVELDGQSELTRAQADALMQRVLVFFEPDGDRSIWSRFARVLSLLQAVVDYRMDPARGSEDPVVLSDLLRSGEPVPGTAHAPEVTAFDRPAAAPMPSRFLFAATLYKDTVSADDLAGKRRWAGLRMAPKLFSLASMSGAYASRLLQRNVSVKEVWGHEVSEHLSEGVTDLLCRYYRSRLWQRFLAGTRLPIVGGVHQHVQDLNAILFYARAEALHRGLQELTEPLIRQALTRVEFHLANQQRFFEHFLRGWMRATLNNIALARSSLGLMALKQAAGQPTAGTRIS